MTTKPIIGLDTPPDYKQWSVARLFSAVLSESDEDKVWDLIHVLRTRGTREVFEWATQFCQSACHVERRVGADILAFIGHQRHAYPEESLAILLNLLSVEQDEEVLASILHAFGQIKRPESIGPASHFRAHLNPTIRRAVVSAISGHEDALAVSTLIQLSRDPQDEIRDWACFGLGTLIDWDTPELREALAERLLDENQETQCEALHGLARRKDPRALSYLIQSLEGGDPCTLDLESATELADPCLYPLLTRLRDDGEGYWHNLLEEAIEACNLDRY